MSVLLLYTKSGLPIVILPIDELNYKYSQNEKCKVILTNKMCKLKIMYENSIM